jgi:hypothetical protein
VKRRFFFHRTGQKLRNVDKTRDKPSVISAQAKETPYFMPVPRGCQSHTTFSSCGYSFPVTQLNQGMYFLLKDVALFLVELWVLLKEPLEDFP